jgi:hypothetical protein
MSLLKPEFIIASEHAILLNVENIEKWEAWKEDKWKKQQYSEKNISGTHPIDYDTFKKENIKIMREKNNLMFYHGLTHSKAGRDLVYKQTGVRIYPFEGKVKIEMIDDPRPEKKLPRVSKETLLKWHKED